MVKNRKPYLKERSSSSCVTWFSTPKQQDYLQRKVIALLKLAVEMVNLSVTGRSLHLYINPERDIDVGAQDIHGLSSISADKPVFADILTKFTDFIKDDFLVIHNAPFDIGFLNAEFHAVVIRLYLWSV